jgi:hypothetical protein
MEIVKTNCPECHEALEFPRDFDNVICSGCGTTFQVREYKSVFNLLPIEKPGRAAAQRAEMAGAADLVVVEARLAELDELIEEVGAEVEVLRSREQSGPLQIGCAFFGLFMLGLTVIIGFMLLGRGYVGHWAFYLTLAAALLLGIARARRKIASPQQVEQFRKDRLYLEQGLAEMESERGRLIKIKQIITPSAPDRSTGDPASNR